MNFLEFIPPRNFYFFIFHFLLGLLLVFSFEQLRKYFYPTPALPAEVKDQVLQEAADFVHAKHRVGEIDDLFQEFLWVSNERLSMKWEEIYGNN